MPTNMTERLKDCKIEIVGETANYIVVEKPAGVLVHPTQANEKDTLIDFVLKMYPEVGRVGDHHLTPDPSPLKGEGEFARPGVVHRLDKEASGLLVIARTQKMFEHLKKQFQDRTVEKEYLVLVYGKMALEHGIIDFDIDRGKDGRMVSRPKTNKLSVAKADKVQPGKEAITEYFLEKQIGRFALLRVKIHTGRMHQIRAHMFAFNHPVVGDKLYCNKKLIKKNEPKLDRLFLHAARLCFGELGGERVCFESQMPEELSGFLRDIGNK
jgi:23S rRNA pseudouridine1911/1915/1917 synthase